MKIYVDKYIDSPKQRVWAAITDIEHCTEMISGITALTILHQPEQGLVGLKWTETRKIFGKESSETMWITHCKDQEYYVTRAENHGAIYVTTMAVAEKDGKTLLSMEFSDSSESIFVRLISAVMGVFLKKSMCKMLNDDLEDIKKFVEQKEHAGPAQS
jgi:carbon monoxide dehydrogenase subunit G